MSFARVLLRRSGSSCLGGFGRQWDGVVVNGRQLLGVKKTKPLAFRSFCAQTTVEEDTKEGSVGECSPKVAELVQQITTLNLVEVAELVSQLKTTLNLPDTPMGMPMGMPMAMASPGPAAGAADAAEEAPAEEKPIVNIQLDKFDEGAKIKVIKEVKSISGLGLKEAKALVEELPANVLTDVKREDAAAIVEALEGVGAKVSLV